MSRCFRLVRETAKSFLEVLPDSRRICHTSYAYW